MEFFGKITTVMPISTGISKTTGKEWSLLTFIVEPQGVRYAKPVAFRIYGKAAHEFRGKPGDFARVDFDLESRPFNGQWYTEATAWRVTLNGGAVESPQPAPSTPGGCPPDPFSLSPGV